MTQKQRRKKIFYNVVGLMSLVLALIGILLPVIPGIPFALLAAICLARGNRTVYFWLMKFKSVRKPVHDWQDYKVIRPKTKLAFVVMLLVTVGAFFVFQDVSVWLKGATLLIIAVMTFWACAQKSKARPT